MTTEHEIFIKSLPASATKETLLNFFSSAGDIVGAPRLMVDSKTGSCKGLGWITFSTDSALQKALSLNGTEFDGRRLSITPGKKYHMGIRPSVQAEGTHTPALCEEVVKKLVSPNTSGVYVDGTFGRGGHTRAMLAALHSSGQVHAFDLDPEAIAVGKELMAADPRFTIHHAPFSSMKSVLKPLGVQPAGALFDLGISSPQFDDSHRGFRPEQDGPLDLRFDNSRGQTAWEFLMSAPREEILRVISEFGETTDPSAARRITDVICLARAKDVLPKRTREFATLVAQGKGQEYQAMHPAKLTFQALRIHLNEEFAEMRNGIKSAFKLMGEGGRIGLITWKHSECAIVVDVFRSLEAVRNKEPLLKWYHAQPGAAALPNKWSMEMDDVVRPSEKELKTNSRSRSALLHILRKRNLPCLADLERMAYELPSWSEVEAPALDIVEAPKSRKRRATADVEEPACTEKRRNQTRPSAVAEPAAREHLAAINAASSAVSSSNAVCNHCGREDHVTKRCTFGARSSDRFLRCLSWRPHLPCFWRRFIVALRSADAEKFDAADPRSSGRADVGMRCISAGLWRSQGLRHSSQVCLSFEASGHTLEVSGALARGLVPDETALAVRVRAGLDALLVDGCGPPDPKQDPEAWCASKLRGFDAKRRTTLAALQTALKQPKRSRAEEGEEEPSHHHRVVLILLSAEGMPVAEACNQIRKGPPLTGVVTIVGDHRGCSEADTLSWSDAATAAGAEVLSVSIGGTTLLASHSIVILQHHLDEQLHCCEVTKQFSYKEQ